VTATVVEPSEGTTSSSDESSPRWWIAWLGPLVVTLIGGWLRFADLARPNAIVFDETYYIKDALSLLRFGYEQGASENADEILLASDGDVNQLEIFTGAASFIVHPPVGKWVIAAGEWAFGATPFGWRFGVALLGTLSVLMLARAVWNMTGNPLWGTVAGLLLAIDGMAIVMSRTAVLDGILGFFVLGAFLALLADRRWIRDRRSVPLDWSWWRPWRLIAAVALGLACGVKWNGIWYLAAFGLMTVLWDIGRRRRNGQDPVVALAHDAIPAAITILSVAGLVYLASWTGWLATDGGWDREWAEGDGLLDAAKSLWHYHAEILNFHTGLATEHSYQSSAWGWLVQARPTSFFYESFQTVDPGCSSGNCSQEVLALGNPLIWWAAILALVHQTWRWFSSRDWRSGAVVLGVLAGWVPWLFYSERTMFAFYSVVFVPFLIASLTLSLAVIATPGDEVQPHRVSPNAHPRITIVAIFLIACVALSWWFYPVWSAEVIDNSAWSERMWFATWI
jgi:dolichyl-phosphate-mannose-protein mannosyltransferase